MENWLPVVGYEGLYEVSDQGRVRSLNRVSGGKRRMGRVLKPAFNGRMFVDLVEGERRRSAAVAVLVLEAFVGPRPPGGIARHFPDRDITNNALVNLSWSTQSQNMLDRRTHGTDAMVNKTHCPQGHPYQGDNIKWKKGGGRNCRECSNEANRRYLARKKIIT